ncbi:MAG: hypothetical protein NC084_08750 [Bacteroides sp.]|nr:hypothetical protein [Eubacterium sp.]MCM1418717.1 hypothetical protein [Roseburia sp.]MCM1462784.1 hypothetical protein [Bacteroides sp.]
MDRVKYFLTILLMLSVVLGVLGGCSDPETEQAHNEERIVYELTGDPSLINLYKGRLYVIDSELKTEKESDITVSVYSDRGKKNEELFIEGVEGTIACWDIFDDVIYFVSENTVQVLETSQWKKSCMLYSVGIKGGEARTLYTFDNLSSIKKIRASEDGMVYCLGTTQSYDGDSDTLYLDNGEIIDYFYSGEVFGSFDRERGEYLESEIAYPVAFDERNGEVIVYAFEKETGFYFYDNKTKAKSYTNKLNQISDMELINDRNDYAFASASVYNGTLAVSGISDESGVIQIDDALYFTRCGSICAEDDYVCVNALEDPYLYDRNVFKYYTANVSTADPPLNVITASYFEPLFSYGSQIKSERLSEEGFALTVLSLDRGYDLVMLNSRESFASDIKEKGSFYPLNDVQGVSEYIDRCFPYIKEAATDDEGKIWMLPISLDVCTMIYHEKNCTENGITFPNDLAAFLEQMRKAAKVSKYRDCSKYLIVEAMIHSYLSLNNSFDTESFRSLAPLLKGMYEDADFESDPSVNVLLAFSTKRSNERLGVSDIYYDTVYDKALFSTVLNVKSQCLLIGDKNLSVASLPHIRGTKNNAFCTFLCVNPNSEHLEETLLFLERMVSHLSDQKNTFVLQDKRAYDDDPLTQGLYKIYEDSQISFTLPTDVYSDDLEKYLTGEITLDDFIAEADRKLAAYLNE